MSTGEKDRELGESTTWVGVAMVWGCVDVGVHGVKGDE